jgi:3-dehydroquinate synthase
VTSGDSVTSEVRVSASAGEYPVLVGAGAIRDLPGLLERHAAAHRYALVADASVHGIHGDLVASRLAETGVPFSVHTFPAGEENKNRSEWARITDEMLAAGVGRDGCVVALGGGVAGDLAGFVAATYMRGIPVVQLPTSLVAMVDSSVGGKSGVDVPSGKNLVGAFHPPRFVLADTELALTLPRAERSQGLAEALKHGAILDAVYFHEIMLASEALLAGDPAATTRLVRRSVELKAEVVSRDEREGGLRQILNFGHTLGHALEALSGYRIPHGSAVAQGMVLETRLGQHLGITPPGVVEQLSAALEGLELPVAPPDPVDPEAVLDAVSRDKKVRQGVARYVLLRELGEVDPGDGWSHAVDPGPVREVFEAASGLRN